MEFIISRHLEYFEIFYYSKILWAKKCSPHLQWAQLPCFLNDLSCLAFRRLWWQACNLILSILHLTSQGLCMKNWILKVAVLGSSGASSVIESSFLWRNKCRIFKRTVTQSRKVYPPLNMTIFHDLHNVDRVSNDHRSRMELLYLPPIHCSKLCMLFMVMFHRIEQKPEWMKKRGCPDISAS